MIDDPSIEYYSFELEEAFFHLDRYASVSNLKQEVANRLGIPVGRQAFYGMSERGWKYRVKTGQILSDDDQILSDALFDLADEKILESGDYVAVARLPSAANQSDDGNDDAEVVREVEDTAAASATAEANAKARVCTTTAAEEEDVRSASASSSSSASRRERKGGATTEKKKNGGADRGRGEGAEATSTTTNGAGAGSDTETETATVEVKIILGGKRRRMEGDGGRPLLASLLRTSLPRRRRRTKRKMAETASNTAEERIGAEQDTSTMIGNDDSSESASENRLSNNGGGGDCDDAIEDGNNEVLSSVLSCGTPLEGKMASPSSMNDLKYPNATKRQKKSANECEGATLFRMEMRQIQTIIETESTNTALRRLRVNATLRETALEAALGGIKLRVSYFSTCG